MIVQTRLATLCLCGPCSDRASAAWRGVARRGVAWRGGEQHSLSLQGAPHSSRDTRLPRDPSSPKLRSQRRTEHLRLVWVRTCRVEAGTGTPLLASPHLPLLATLRHNAVQSPALRRAALPCPAPIHSTQSAARHPFRFK